MSYVSRPQTQRTQLRNITATRSLVPRPSGRGCGWITSPLCVVSSPDPTNAAADGLHHRYASVGMYVIHPQLRPLGLGTRLKSMEVLACYEFLHFLFNAL